MSGTSLDGVDLVFCDFNISEMGNWSFDIISTETTEYQESLKKELQEGIHYSANQLKDLDHRYTKYLAGKISEFIEKNKIEKLDAICSHGHTIKHQPENGVTIQIGNNREIALITGYNLVCDFRVQDVQLGGQGAPLVPIGDQLLFSKYDYCLNLGGFANVSLDNGERVAYDVCPVNIVLNHYSEKLGLDFDDKGNLASQGKLNIELLKDLNGLGYYKKRAPKSLGLEWVLSSVFPLIQKYDLEIRDILHTFIEHIAIQLSMEFDKYKSVFITGGGVYNSYLIERLKHHSNIDIIIPERELIDYKEALIFGLLGVLKLRGENNCLSSVTGAKKDHSSGIIFNPK